jgi:hypothetical protein
VTIRARATTMLVVISSLRGQRRMRSGRPERDVLSRLCLGVMGCLGSK